MKSKHPKAARSQQSVLDTSDSGYLKDKVILVTGGTGSFGKRFIDKLLKTEARKIIIFSRDELKQSEMQASLKDPLEKLRFFLGDIRDQERLHRAFVGVNYVVHAAALKQVPTLEYNPFEAIKTNVIGSQNIIDAAINQGVERVIALSTDKAANPCNLYGATKLCSEKLFVAGNSYAGTKSTRFSAVRYGNVIGSRGSVVPLFLARKESGSVPITDERMTRFWITLDQGVNFVVNCLRSMTGGEIFVPKISSMRIVDLAKALAPGCKLMKIGMRPGERLHEVLLTDDESARTRDLGDHYAIHPAAAPGDPTRPMPGIPVAPDFRYASETNSEWLTEKGLEGMMRSITGS